MPSSGGKFLVELFIEIRGLRRGPRTGLDFCSVKATSLGQFLIKLTIFGGGFDLGQTSTSSHDLRNLGRTWVRQSRAHAPSQCSATINDHQNWTTFLLTENKEGVGLGTSINNIEDLVIDAETDREKGLGNNDLCSDDRERFLRSSETDLRIPLLNLNSPI